MAVAVVAAARGAEHRGGEPDDAGLEDRLPVTGDGSQTTKWSVSGFLRSRRPWRQYMGAGTLGLATQAAQSICRRRTPPPIRLGEGTVEARRRRGLEEDFRSDQEATVVARPG